MKYATVIESASLVSALESTLTTGDLDYNGTALEFSGPDGDDLFHAVVDKSGELHFLFFRSEGNFRIPVHAMEQAIQAAKRMLRSTDY